MASLGEASTDCTEEEETSEELVTIMQTHHSRSYKVKLTVQGDKIKAGVYTAAERTLLSDRVFNGFKIKTSCNKELQVGYCRPRTFDTSLCGGPSEDQIMWHSVQGSSTRSTYQV